MTIHAVPIAKLVGSGLGLQDVSPIEDRSAIAARTAGHHARTVDQDARFPVEAMDAVREQRLLGLLIPRELGGEGAGIADVADVCFTLGRACASTAMIYAMHQTKVACIVRHGRGAPWHDGVLRRIAQEQLLLASSTTEGQNGGNVRTSTAAVELRDSGITLDRAASVISYGAEADGIVTTARRSVDSTGSDQVLLVLLKADYTLERVSGWDTLGMRGTCSAGFRLRAQGSVDQIVPERYDRIHAETMTPVSHLLWSSAWAGIAASAVERAQKFIRHASRQSGGQLPPGAVHYAEAASTLRTLRALIASTIERFDRASASETLRQSVDYQTSVTLLKVDASEMAVAIVMRAMRACGLSGYRQDGDFSIGRHLRDILSSPIMIHNDRILATAGAAVLMAAAPQSLRG